MHKFAAFLGLAVALGSSLHAAELIHYWDFDTLQDDYPVDTVGGVTTSPIGAPAIAVDEIYGEAYAGSANSLNSTLGVPNYLVAEVFDGSATAFEFGAGDFSYSYWSYDASDLDGDVRGPRVFDMLRGTEIGIQVATNLTGIFNFRIDDDAGGVVISNEFLSDVNQPDGEWVHVAVNVDRTAGDAEIFFNGVSQGSYDVSLLTGNVSPTQDMQIGVINNGTNAAGVQQSGLDDLAFYTGTLSGAQISGLASAGLAPTDITEGPKSDFEITGIDVAANGEVTLEWNSEPNLLYIIETSAIVGSGWFEILDEIESQGEITSHTFTLQNSPAEAFCGSGSWI